MEVLVLNSDSITSNNVTIYEPESREKMTTLAIWSSIINNIIQYREMIYVLFKRDFFASYKKSFLGMSWVIIAPIMGIISWVIINAAGILIPGDVGIPYPAYVLLSTSIWGLFMGFYSAAQNTINAGSGIINQVKYPHEILLIKQVAQQLATFSITFIVNIIVLLFYGIIPSWKIIFFPFALLPILFLASGIGLIVSLFTVVATDIAKGFDLLMGLLIWVTPVIYASDVANQTLQLIIRWNPLTYLIGTARDLLIRDEISHLNYYAYSVGFSIIVFLFAWRFFYLAEDKLIEKML